ncbi:MAG: hypothetical protein ACYCZC_00980 [Acidithiobacillus sp.]
MKSARITFLGTQEFKVSIERQAAAQGISVGELVRRRFDRAQTEDEQVLAALAEELRRSVAEARAMLSDGLAEADLALAEFRSHKETAA